jgi:hypothetical protein
MKAKWIVVLSAVLLGAAAVFAGGPYYLTSAGSNNSGASFSDKSYWLDSSGNAYEGESVFDPEADYVVEQGRILSTYKGWQNVAPSVFTGRTLALGNASTGKRGDLYLTSSGNQTIQFTKLMLVKGESVNTYVANAGTVIEGSVDVVSPADAPFQFRNYYGGCIQNWTGSFSGGSDSGILVGGNACRSNFTFKATGDWSGYKGTVFVRKGTVTPLKYDTAFCCQTSSSFPGTLVMEESTRLTLLGGNDVFSVGSLSLGEGVKITLPATATANARILATGSFECQGRVVLDVLAAVPAENQARTVEILTVPGDAEIDVSMFSLDGRAMERMGILGLSVDGETGAKTLYVEFAPFIYKTVTDAQVVHDKTKTSGFDDKNWSNGELPTSRAHYFINRINNQQTWLRTPVDAALDLDFAGLSLTFDSWCYFHVFCRSFSVPKLTMKGTTRIWVENETPSFTIKGGELCAVSGGVELGAYASSLFVVESEVTGAAELKIQGVASTSYPRGFVYLKLLNTNFQGTVTVSMIGNTASLANCDTCQTLYVNDGRNVGGTLPEMNYKALTLSNYGRLCVTGASEVVFSGGVNRGIHVEGFGQMRAGKDEAMVLERPLTLNGELFKDGAGSLVLASEARFGADAGAEPVEGKDRLTVKEGSLVVGGNAACDGIGIVLADGAELVVKADPDDPDRMAYGIRNVKTDEPLALSGDASKISIRVDASAFGEVSGDDAPVSDMGLMTVSSAAAPAVRAMLPGRIQAFEGVRKGRLFERKGPTDDTVTFALDFTRKGMNVVIR